MKTIETKLFNFDELAPEAKAKVIERERQRVYECPDDPTAGECVDSLKAIASGLGLRLTDWCIGPYNRNNRASVNSDEFGNKAVARLARCLSSHGYTIPARFKDMKFVGVCGFTGVCFDEDMAEAIWGALLDGETMTKAFDRAADLAMRICEDDLEYRAKDETILEYLDTKAEVYTEDGDEF